MRVRATFAHQEIPVNHPHDSEDGILYSLLEPHGKKKEIKKEENKSSQGAFNIASYSY